MPKINIPIGDNSIDMSAEAQHLNDLIFKSTKTSTGQIVYSSSTSGMSYRTVDYPNDPDIYNKGDLGMIRLLQIKLGDSNGFVTVADDFNKLVMPSDNTPTEYETTYLLDEYGNKIIPIIKQSDVILSDTNNTTLESIINNLQISSEVKKPYTLVIGSSAQGHTVNGEADYICGTSNANVQINQAIQALPSTGGEIIVLEGVYNLGAIININKPNVTIRGMGRATRFIRNYVGNTNEGMFNVYSYNFNLYDVSIEGNLSSYPTQHFAISLNSINPPINSTIANCYIINNTFGIYAWGNSFTVYNCTFENNYTNIYAISSTNVNILSNTITTGATYGIALLHSDNCIVSGNIITDCTTGVYLYLPDTTNNNMIISGNIIQRNSLVAGTYGIRISTGAQYIGVNVTDNIITNFTNGILTDNVVTFMHVNDNIITGCTEGINVSIYDGSLSSNVINRCTNIGIRLGVGSEYTTISYNNITECGPTDTTGAVYSNYISGNKISVIGNNMYDNPQLRTCYLTALSNSLITANNMYNTNFLLGSNSPNNTVINNKTT